MREFLEQLKISLEKIDGLRDKYLSFFILPCWPRIILPNHLTISRIIIGVFLSITLFYYNNNDKAIIISLFLIGALTDLLDGSVARALKKETKLGAILDPIADRILIIPIAFYSLFSSYRWLLLFLIILEIANGFVSMNANSKNIFLGPNIFGKTKMVLQSVVFAAILIFWPKTPHPFFITILWLSTVSLGISIFFKIIEIHKKYEK